MTPASDDLDLLFLEFIKAFDGPTIAGGTPQLTFTIQNLDTSRSVSGLHFSDTLDLVIPGLMSISLPQVDVCGAGSRIAGTSVLVFTDGDLGPGDSCTFSVDLLVPPTAEAGSYFNTTSDLRQAGIPVSNPASDTLIVEPSGTIIIEKETVPEGDPTLFEFVGDLAGNIGDGQTLSAKVVPGNYTSTELAPVGWELDRIICEDVNSFGNSTGTVTFDVDPGEVVTCTFTNTKVIVIESQTLPDDSFFAEASGTQGDSIAGPVAPETSNSTDTSGGLDDSEKVDSNPIDDAGRVDSIFESAADDIQSFGSSGIARLVIARILQDSRLNASHPSRRIGFDPAAVDQLHEDTNWA